MFLTFSKQSAIQLTYLHRTRHTIHMFYLQVFSWWVFEAFQYTGAVLAKRRIRLK